MQDRINQIINNKFGTDRGYLYIVDQIKKEWPYFNINEENLADLTIVPMPEDYYRKTGFVGEYVAKRNEIKISPIYNSEDELLETFVHEFVHCITTKIVNNMILEGINMRTLDGRSSFALFLNEGITQYITNKVLGIKSDAYIFETNIAEQFICILGEEKVLTSYSNRNIDDFVDAINAIDQNVDVIDLVSRIYGASLNINYRQPFNDDMHITNLQESMIDLYKKSPMIDDERFSKLILDSEKAEAIINPPQLKGLMPQLDIYTNGFCGIDNIDKSFSSKK